MNDQSFSTTIEIPASSHEVFNKLKDVSNWWGGKDFEGKSSNLGDEFVICHPGLLFSRQRLVEVVPDKKMVWLVTEGKLDWLQKDKEEWTNTKMIFELSVNHDNTILYFTHEGLVPGKECYALCHQGWNWVIKDLLFNFIISGRTIHDHMNNKVKE